MSSWSSAAPLRNKGHLALAKLLTGAAAKGGMSRVGSGWSGYPTDLRIGKVSE